MQYRKLGKTGLEISAVSLGTLRIPSAAEGGPHGVRERSDAIRAAIDRGVNYLNLGYPSYFKDPGAACEYVRAALGGGYRDKVMLALNIPSAGITSSDDLERSLRTQLELFGLESVDFCIIDKVSRFPWQKLKDAGLDKWADSVLERGLAKMMGLSFHDDAYYLEEINKYYPRWSLLEMEYSFLDHKHHPGMGGFKFTEQYGLGVVATDVLKGGRLLKNIPGTVLAVWEQAPQKRPPEEWAIRWTLSHQDVSSALFEFEDPAQAGRYIDIAETATPGCADVFENVRASKARDAYYAARAVQCTSCRCCMPCPFDVDVPRIVELYNDAVMFSDDTIPRFLYNLEGHPKTPCRSCGLCEKSCPKRLPLMDVLEKAAQRFASGERR